MATILSVPVRTKKRKRVLRTVRLLSEIYGLPYILVRKVYHKYIPSISDNMYDSNPDLYRVRLSIVKDDLLSIQKVVHELDFIDTVNYSF